MIKRNIEEAIIEASKKIGVISIMGPRQSGKTILSQKLFPNYKYYNLEDLSVRELIDQDPKRFIFDQKEGIILDEVQKYPELLSYIQVNIDDDFRPAKFVITGSENLLLSEKVNQSLAGRVTIFQLLPLSIDELITSNQLKENHFEQMYNGFYPRIYNRNLLPKDLYPDYVSTYVERDVRKIKNIGDLSNFQRFLQLLAGRTGQILNLNEIGNDIGVNYKTIDSWISLLEATYIIFRLEPYFENFGKRVIKSPKIFFYDTGLVCYLLGLNSSTELQTHYAHGNIFENMIVADVKKQLFNSKSISKMYFWRDSNQNEIDLIISHGNDLIPIEIKAGSTFSANYLKGIKVWESVQKNIHQSYIVYTGNEATTGNTKLVNWKNISQTFDI